MVCSIHTVGVFYSRVIKNFYRGAGRPRIGKMEFPNWEILKKVENGEIEIVWGSKITY